MKRTRVMGSIVFSGDIDPDPDGAAVPLCRAGFEVTRMPEKFRPIWCIFNDEIDVVDRYGG